MLPIKPKKSVVCQYKKMKDGWQGNVASWDMGYPSWLNPTLPYLKDKVRMAAKFRGEIVKFVRAS